MTTQQSNESVNNSFIKEENRRRYDEYTIKPEAIELLGKKGIIQKVELLAKELEKNYEMLRFEQTYFPDQIIRDINILIKSSTYKDFPKKSYINYGSVMNDILQEKGMWKIHKQKDVIVPTNTLDLQIFSGLIPLEVLSKKQLWKTDDEFTHPTSFPSLVGAYLVQHFNRSSTELEQGYKWTFKKNGKIIENVIGNSMHNDFRIFQKDSTTYDATDPFGNKSTFRPVLNSDIKTVSGYHSTEGFFLATVIKYIDQQKIESKLFKDKAKELMDWLYEQEAADPAFKTDSGGTPRSSTSYMNLNTILNIPVLDNNFHTEKISSFGVPSQFGRYNAYIGPCNELIFSYAKDSIDESEKKSGVTFQPEEIDHLLKGVMYQSIKGMGRTHISELVGVLKYRFSDYYKKEFEMNEKYRNT